MIYHVSFRWAGPSLTSLLNLTHNSSTETLLLRSAETAERSGQEEREVSIKMLGAESQ